ncbi:glycosyltransferase family 2 protein [Patescibacteria group bacterium]|nr:glycosyltransferase family 2 protein [Patescibacteria group bacterium]MBU1029219.1 glycosyltransferase family 2 protein [Patescibacteria group bacterium]
MIESALKLNQSQKINESKIIVTVVIPVYNRPIFIRRAIDSVIAQTYKNWELIIVDDCSTDNTVEVIRSYLNKNERISLICLEKNRGVSNARNIGIEKASGEYIAFLDSDDEWFPDKLTKQVRLFQQDKTEQVGFVGCNRIILVTKTGQEHRSRLILQDNTLRMFLSRCFVVPSGVVVKKKVFTKVGLFDINLDYSEDWDMWIRIAEKFSFALIDEPLFKYYEHGGNACSDPAKLNKRESDTHLVLRKHERLYMSDYKLQSERERYLGHIYASWGLMKRARKKFLSAWKINPTNLMVLFCFMSSLFGAKGYFFITSVYARLKN